MAKKLLNLVTGMMLIALVLTACGGADENPTPTSLQTTVPTTALATEAPTVAPTVPATFDRRAMLATVVDELILPLHTQLAEESAALAAAVTAFAASPSVDTLAAAQTQWKVTAEARAATEPFRLRFAMLVTPAVKKWPINTGFIEEFIAGEDVLDAAFVENSGSTAKGLTAIEYFLFSQTSSDAEIVDALTADPRRMDYLVALAQNLEAVSAELLRMWSPDGDNQAQAFVEADFSANEIQGSMSMLANEMIVLVEEIAKTKVDYPLRGVFANPQPDSVESPYAAYSIPLIVANLHSVQAIMDLSYGPYLDYLQAGSAEPLSAAIDAQFDEIYAALDAIDQPLRVAVLEDPDAVRAARDAINTLSVLLKADMANLMGITVTISDNDGD